MAVLASPTSGSSANPQQTKLDVREIGWFLAIAYQHSGSYVFVSAALLFVLFISYWNLVYILSL